MEAERSVWGRVVSLVVLSLIVGGVAGGVAGALTARILSDGELEETAAPVGIATPTSGGAVSLSEESAITEAVGKALPSVVAIVSEEATLPGEDQQPVALGSGVIIDERGYIVTNEHVVRDATSVRVALYGGEERQATVVGHDSPFTDLAVLKIPSGGLSPMSVGDSDALVSGQRVIAVGNPLHDFRSSVSVGVVSGVQRRWQRDGIFMEDLIQTDAAVNPGNSGGALIDVLGQLVGMPTSVVRSDNGRDVEGIALAISSKTIREVAGEIIEQGRVRRAYLGVSHIDLTPEVAVARGLREQRGAWISSVGEATPAAQAGIEVGDVILRMGGQDVTASAPFLNVLMGLQPDETVPVVLSRDGQQLTVDVTPIQRPQRP